VHDAARALELVRDRRFDVAVVDVVMPGMDGLTLLDRLREEDPLLEVIILTGNPRVGDVRRGLKQGAFDYLVKPCALEDLARAIRSARDRRSRREEEARISTTEAILATRPD
jgi:DNA-binding NtrC family response regulator